jgi:tetratricopeptide (TPR) repeat protein
LSKYQIMKTEVTSVHNPKFVAIKRWVRIITAVTAVALLLLIVWEVYQVYQLSTEKMFTESYTPYKLESNAIDSLTTIEQYYKAEAYKDVIRESKKVFSVNDKEKLLVGLSYFETAQYLPAISWLKRLLSPGDNPYRQTAEYYLTLAHLKNEDYDRAMELMEVMIKNANHPYHQKFTTQMIKDLRLIKWK